MVVVNTSILVFANGRGPVFQFIATACSILAIVFGEGLIGRAAPDDQFFFDTGSRAMPDTLVETAWVMAVWDPWTCCCAAVGVSGGMYTWKYN